MRACSFVTELRTCARTVSPRPAAGVPPPRRCSRERAASGPRRSRAVRPRAGAVAAIKTSIRRGPIRHRSFVRREMPVLLRSEDRRPSWVPTSTNGGCDALQSRCIPTIEDEIKWSACPRVRHSLLAGVQGERRLVAAQPAGAHVRAAGQAHRLQEDSRAAALVRGRRPDLVRNRDFDRRDRPLGPGEGRGPGAIPLDAHSRSGPRRAAAPRLGAALVAPARARHAEGAGDLHGRARPPPTPRRAGEHDEPVPRGALGQGVRDPPAPTSPRCRRCAA